jgi:preprotein translocase subunit SecG
MLFYLVLTVYVLVSFLLLVVVLLQQGKGGDIAAAFGGSSSQTAFGARAGATVLTRATTVLGAMFVMVAFVLSIMGRTGGGSVTSGLEGPAPTQQTAPALPELPAATPEATAPAGDGTPAPADGQQPQQ